MDLTKKVLLISPYFPPHRAIGTKRAINFVQGVHRKDDWEVIVLASKPFNDNNDPELLDQIPDEVKVDYGFVGIFRPIIRFLSGSNKKKKPQVPFNKVQTPKPKTKKKKKESLTPFDQYLWDVGSAIRNGKKLIRKHKPDVIWVNADPWSGFIVAHSLSRKFDIPWVADMRDPWTIFSRRMESRPKVTQKLIRHFEKKFFSSASKVVLNSRSALETYKGVYPSSISEKLTYIRNAFNEELLPVTSSFEKKEIFTFGYYGGFRPFVPSDYILKGFSSFVRKNNLDSSQVKLEVTGSVYDDFWHQVKEHNLEKFVQINKEVNAKDTISLLRSWDVLLLSAIHDLRWQMPAKFYDYLFARRPVLAVSDYDELNELIEQTRSGHWVNTSDTGGAAELFEKYFKLGKSDLLDNKSLIEPFGVPAQALRFRETLNDVISNK